MKKIIDLGMQLLQKYRLFVLYSAIGTLSASLDFVVFTTLVKWLCLPYLLSNIISVNSGIITSFLLNRHFNFKVKDKAGLRFIIFYSVGLLGLLISTILLWLLVEYKLVNTIVAKTFTIVIVVLVQFTLNKYITFKKYSK